MNSKIREILSNIERSDYIKGSQYYFGYVDHINKNAYGDTTKNYFRVESERTSRLYECHIEVDNIQKSILHVDCDCPQFNSTHSCKHIGACLYYYFDDLFSQVSDEQYIEKVTTRLFSLFNEKDKANKKRNVKEEVIIDIYLDGNNNDANYMDYLNLTLRVGTDKLYSCKEGKLSKFLSAVKNEENFSFGKNFEYNPDKHYFSEQTKKILNYLMFLDEHNDYHRNILFGESTIKNFLELIKDKKVYMNNILIKKQEHAFPFSSKLTQKEEKYILEFIDFEQIRFITSDLEYIQMGSTLYHLNHDQRLLLLGILSNGMTSLVFNKTDKNSFSNSVLPLIQNQIEIDSSIEDFKICKNITPKLYFDLYYDKVICNLVFDYDSLEINYFDQTDNIVRDKQLEETVIEDLYSRNFVIEKDKILLDSIDHIGNFLEKDLLELTEKYETYTSEKLKKIRIIKKTNVKSTFSIGKDNIMSYSFDLGDIQENEIVNVLSALKSKKKYYRLKSGDIIDLENDQDLEELNDLVEDMGLSQKDVSKGTGEIPKFRAIYLDSLKKDKYHIIETNNLFDELITKFNQYKDSEITLSSKEKQILRDYQEDGVKWLYNIDKTGFGGILADEMGLGKSIQTIYYIKELLKENKDYKFLIVSPTSLAYNWENEFDKFEPNIPKKVLVGNRNIRRDKFNQLDSVNVIITTYGLLREDYEYYEQMQFKTMIIDEAQNIKNVQTEITKTVKKIKADTKFALTGTPIENSIIELWSIFDYIMPGFLSGLQTFDKKYKVKEFDEDTNKKLSNLNRLISPFILRRLKKDVINDLPEKLENNIYIELTKEQKKIYLAELEKVNQEMEEIISTGGMNQARFVILKLLTKLRQICIDPRIIFPEYVGGSGKINEFIKVVEESISHGHKILIFTSFKQALELAKKELKKRKITSYTIDGSTSSKKRIELVDKFNQDNTNVFFIMLKAGGTGLNLTSADVVIHLDLWWNPQAENQATDRAHRIGQKNVVEVIKFITRGTIEEKILELQNKKKILSDKLIDENNTNMAFSQLTEKDIKTLLSYENEEE